VRITGLVGLRPTVQRCFAETELVQLVLVVKLALEGLSQRKLRRADGASVAAQADQRSARLRASDSNGSDRTTVSPRQAPTIR